MPRGWAIELVDDSAEDEISPSYTNISETNIVEGSARRRRPPSGAPIDTSVQKNKSNHLDHKERSHEDQTSGKNDSQARTESPTVTLSRIPHSKGKSSAESHPETPITEAVFDSERLEIPEEPESVIVVERTPKRTKTKRRSSQTATVVKKPVFHVSEANELEKPEGSVINGGDLSDNEGIIVETSPPGSRRSNVGSSSQTLTFRPSKAAFNPAQTRNRADGLINTPDTDLGLSRGSTTSLNEGFAQNNSSTSISQRSEPTLPSTGFHNQRSPDSQSTSLPLDQTLQRQPWSSFKKTTQKPELQYSFPQSTNSLQDKATKLQTEEPSTVLPSTPAFSSSDLAGTSNSTTHSSDSKSIAAFQFNMSTTTQLDQGAHNMLITGTKNMADAGAHQTIPIELDDDNSSVLSDLDSQEDFTEVEAAFKLVSQQQQPAAGQESNMSPTKSRLARQRKPTTKAMQQQKKQMPKKPRGRPPKEKNVLQRAAAYAKVVTKQLPAKCQPKVVATRASGRKKVSDEKDEKDDFQPGKGVEFTMSGSGMSLRDRASLKAPAALLDQVAATADLVPNPGSKTGKTRATTQKRATPPAPRTPKQSKKPPPKSARSAEPNPSPHDSGFSEVSSTDDDKASSDFSPASSSSSDSPETSSIISSSSPEDDLEDDIVEPSSPEAAPQKERKSRPYLNTNITVKDADARTDPPIGPELSEYARKACRSGQIAKRWNPEVARRVDGIWMAPERCDSCRANKRDNCDRAFPCSVCAKSGKPCNVRTVMTRTACRDNVVPDDAITPLHLNAPIVSQNGDETWNSTNQTPPMIRPQKRKRGDVNKATAKSRGRRAAPTTGDKISSKPIHPSEVPQHLKAPHTFQNGNGSWNVLEQALPTGNVDKRKRKYAGGSEATGNSSKKHRMVASGYSSSEETYLEGPTNPTRPLVRSKKERGAPHNYIAYHRSEQDNLPAPYGEPPVWASKRQQLCETLPYYRAYMSGGYLHDGLVRAFLIDKEVRERDIFGEEVVITRCGGGRKLDEASGKMLQASNQETSACGLAFERARDMCQGNRKSQTKLPHYYNVLDWFHVTDVWIEKVEGFKTWCVRMEKIRLDQKSWWAKAGSALPSPYRDLNAIKAASVECCRCRATSKVIFEQGWTCLRASCEKFFEFDSPVDDQTLVYTEAFMNERTAYSGMTPGPLAPPLATEADMIIAGRSGTEASFKRGIVCPLCKGCSRRKDWSKWRCETAGCNFTHSLPIRTVSVEETMSESARHRRGQNYEREFGIKMEAKRLGAYNVFEYGVPGPEGNIVGVLRLLKSTSVINRQPDGPDELFQLMQEKDFDLRRRPVRQLNSSGEVITNHFATNWGAPYKFVVAQSSRGFSEAPTVIIKALKRLTWAGEQTLTDVGEPFHPFNELLSIGYFEDCSIGFHDDGESTLGPTVATLSLGCSATMSLRPKAKAEVGITSRNAKGTKAPIIRVTLEHGDMVIMHGSGVQQYYEHEVVPHGTLRFALTCRYIKPDALESDAEREEASIKGALPEGHDQYNYDGDENYIFTPEEIKKAEKEARLNALMRMFNDAAVVCKAGASQGDSEELSQMRDLMGDQMRNLIGQFENGALAPGVVAEPMCRKDAEEEVDVTMLDAP
ncbi:hypothetical protein V494_08611 [Pseudogymnoascus sp. VKM F-4513 (FW-928)]|nr:hypothetical protein V494_08611 [Pseudogymnoascus sp. VKM F-4513 (FW-928)]